jgi:hypothetical protein
VSDRVIRDELWQSMRWLDLATDTHRLVYVSLLPIADDFGNFEGGPRRLYRWMVGFTQVKSEPDSIKLMSELQDADLVRRYEVDGKEYWHIPRFKNTRQYWARKAPQSPYAEEEIPRSQMLRQKIRRGKQEPSASTSEGVGVGVGNRGGGGVGEVQKQNQGTVRAARSPFVLPDWIPEEHWLAWIEARTKAKHPPTDYTLGLAGRKLQNLREQGESPAQLLMRSAFNSWSDFYPQKEAK